MIFEAAHQMALLPIAVLAALAVTGRDVARSHVWIATALAVSWVGDSIQHYGGGDFWGGYFWVPVQFAAAFIAVLPDSDRRLAALWAVAMLTSVSVFWSYPGPEVVLTITCSVWLVLAVHGRLTLPVRVYFGIGTALYFAMAGAYQTDTFMLWWGLYQAARAVGVLSLCWLCVVHAGVRNERYH